MQIAKSKAGKNECDPIASDGDTFYISVLMPGLSI